MALSPGEAELIYTLAAQHVGSHHEGSHRHSVLISNVERRMEQRGCRTLGEYLGLAEREPGERDHLLSALTIHTTSWFREQPHFDHLRGWLPERANRGMLRLWSAACSTGEEAWSFALVLEAHRRQNPGFEWQIHASDIDPISVRTAQRALYPASALPPLPPALQPGVLHGSGRSAGLVTLSPEIRRRVTFSVRSLLHGQPPGEELLDWIVCRNVLIYFAPDRVQEAIGRLARLVRPGGVLCLGHSEALVTVPAELRSLSHSLYERAEPALPSRLVARRPEVVLVGASTGGPEALEKLLVDTPPNCPPILVVQHISQPFARPLAERLAANAGLRLGHSHHGEPLRPGHLYMALGDHHIGVMRAPRASDGTPFVLQHSHAAPVGQHRPAVEFLFASAVRAQAPAVGILLTGMGRDGAAGLLALRQAGALTMAQDEASSVVFGMPAEAIRLGAAHRVGNPSALRRLLHLAIATRT